MKYKIKQQLNLSIFSLLLVATFSAQAFSLNDYFKEDGNDELAQEEVAQPAATQQQAETYKTGRAVQHDQWILQCAESNLGNEKCNLIHQINNKNNQQIIKIEVLKSADGDLMLFHLPLGTYLPAGATLIVGEGIVKMPIVSCMPAGCQAKTKLDWNLKQKLKREEKAVVQLLHINQQQKINIEFSLMGYSKGSQEIK